MYKKLMFLFLFLIVNLSVPVSAELVGYWKLNEGTGTIINDSSVYGHNGTIDPWNAALVDWTTDGYKNGALEFNTTTGTPYTYVDAPLTQRILNIEQATYAFWMRMPQNHQPWGIIFDLIGESTDYSMEPGDAGELYNYTPWFGNTSFNYNDNEWHHVATTFSTPANLTIIYVDGVEISRSTAGGNEDIQTVRIGGPREYNQVWASFTGTLDEVTVFNHTLSAAEVESLYMTGPAAPTLATTPSPADGATDVLRDTILSWESGDNADKHNVYLGKVFEDVNSADTDSPLLVGPAQENTTYIPDRLELGQTYFWRVDEIEADGSTVHKGNIWSFKVELLAYPIPGQNITATASSFEEGHEPENTINSSGLNADDLHSTDTETMWLSDVNDPGPVWIQYEFDRVYKLHEMLVWNYNGSSIIAWSGIKNVTVEYSIDDVNWTQVSSVTEFAKAPGTAGYAANTTVAFNDAAAKFVRINALSNWSSGILQDYGLSEVSFTAIPVSARKPGPPSGETNVAVDVILGWEAGRQAAEHNVYISTEEQFLSDGSVSPVTVTDTSYGPLSLDMGTDYYWTVEEVNNAEIPAVWQSDIWNFTTQNYVVVDDFESYNDIIEGMDGSNLVYNTWTDGYLNPSINGSTIGYVSGASMETNIVHSGDQSVPIGYDNSIAGFSEVTVSPVDLPIGRNWTKGGAQTLVLWFYGDPDNATSEQMYVKIGSKKVIYDGDPDDLTKRRWIQWNIDLASLGISLSNVSTFSIGFERTDGTGGSGTVLLDDIRLYREAPPVAVPTDPGTDALVAYYAFENNANDSSGNGLDGTIVGTPGYVAGVTGMALSLDGVDDHVDCGDNGNFDITEAITLSAWVNTSDAGNSEHNPFVCKGDQSYAIKHASGNSIEFFIYDSTWQTLDSPVNDSFNGVWHHVAGTFDGNRLLLYVDGSVVKSMDYTGAIAKTTYPVNIGRNSQNTDRLYEGLIDEVRIYDRALSEGEILFLANL